MKNPFADFLEKIELAGCDEPLGEAYRMDGCAPNPSMRDRAGLGTLACCDYLRADGENFILIEDTELGGTALQMEEEYDSLKGGGEQRRQFIRERIRRENCLKVYGSLLVLCRLKQWPTRCAFWLVISGDAGQAKVARNLSPNGELEAEIASALKGESDKQSTVKGALMAAKLVDDVKVITADELRKMLKERG